MYYPAYDFQERPGEVRTATLSGLVRGATSTIWCPGAGIGRNFCKLKSDDESTLFTERGYDYNTGPFTPEVPFTGEVLHYIVLSWDIQTVLSGGWPDWMMRLGFEVLARPLRFSGSSQMGVVRHWTKVWGV